MHLPVETSVFAGVALATILMFKKVKRGLKSWVNVFNKGAADSGVSILNTAIVVGFGGPEGFLKLQKLADALGGAVGASRAAVDAGWISKDHLIGQSGKTVRPDLYINFGISGSVQHITGMRGARHVISVNTDPKAFIFDMSDEAIVADLFQVLPALEARLKKIKKQLTIIKYDANILLSNS